MWLYTRYGFLSVVQHYDKCETMVVRARLRKDIKAFIRFAKKVAHIKKVQRYKQTKQADYRFRVEMSREDFMTVMLMLVQDLDYGNFKAEVHGDRDRDNAYMDCWSAMFRLQTKAEGGREWPDQIQLEEDTYNAITTRIPPREF